MVSIELLDGAPVFAMIPYNAALFPLQHSKNGLHTWNPKDRKKNPTVFKSGSTSPTNQGPENSPMMERKGSSASCEIRSEVA